MKNRLIIINHIGTSMVDTITTELNPLVKEVATRFTNIDVILTFSSNRAINKLANRGIQVATIDEAMHKGFDKGYSSIEVLPLHIVGDMDIKMTKDYIKQCVDKIQGLDEKPLIKLYDELFKDEVSVHKLAEELVNESRVNNKCRHLVLVGSKQSDSKHPNYLRLKEALNNLEINSYIITLTEDPNKLVNELKLLDITEVVIVPLFSITNHHGQKDIFDNESGIYNTLVQSNINVKSLHGGLINNKNIRDIYIDRLDK